MKNMIIKFENIGSVEFEKNGNIWSYDRNEYDDTQQMVIESFINRDFGDYPASVIKRLYKITTDLNKIDGFKVINWGKWESNLSKILPTL